MDAVRLLAEYGRRHAAGRAGGGWSQLASLFTADGLIVFHGIPAPPMHGRAEIEEGFRTRGPDDDLVLGDGSGAPRGAVKAVYGWRTTPDLVDGSIRITPRHGRIARLDVIALPGGPQLPRERRAVRAIIVAPGPALLLVRHTESPPPPPLERLSWWVAPGGGIGDGEPEEDALRRELAEEAGIGDGFSIGPCLLERRHTFVWDGRPIRQHERFRLVRVDRATAQRPRLDAAALAAEGIDAHRWWTLDAMRKSPAEAFVPRRLAEFVERFLRDGPPATPADPGV